MKKLIILAALLSLFGLASAHGPSLKDGHPNRYVVQEGDSLWKIAGKFLNKPWEWEQLWDNNANIDDPHLIYPGDVLVLSRVNGRMVLRVGDRGMKTKHFIPAIPLSKIEAFFTQDMVVDGHFFDHAPYVIGGPQNRIAATHGERVYVRGIGPHDPKQYSIYRMGKAYAHPHTHEFLGYRAVFVGDGEVTVEGDPATFYLTRSKHGVHPGDRLIPQDYNVFEKVFHPKAPPKGFETAIIDVIDGLTNIGTFDVVAIDCGAAQGVEPGFVLEVFRLGKIVPDMMAEKDELVRLPSEHVGTLMVFRTFDHVSYALVVEATDVMYVLDNARSPA